MPSAGWETITGEENVLILAPRPGDEVRLCGGFIALGCRLGRPPFVVVLTDGAAASVRSLEPETRAAARLLGLPANRLLLAGLFYDSLPAEGPSFEAIVHGITTVMWARDCNVICAPSGSDRDGAVVDRIAGAVAERSGGWPAGRGAGGRALSRCCDADRGQAGCAAGLWDRRRACWAGVVRAAVGICLWVVADRGWRRRFGQGNVMTSNCLVIEMRIVRVFGAASVMVWLMASDALAQIKVGAIISISGPTAALGVGYRAAFSTFPAEVDGKSVTYIIRDDAADASNSVSIAQRMIEEDHVDVIIGPTLTACANAVQPIANAAKVPMIATAPLDYDPAKYPYTFSAVQPVSLMVDADVENMKKRGVKTVAFIGFSDGFGDQVYEATKAAADKAGIEVVANERYARTDTSTESQVLKALSKKPDAVMVGASGTPATLPVSGLHRRGFKGLVYGNHGMVSPAFLKVGGAGVEGLIAVTGPVVVADQLPESAPSRGPAMAFNKELVAKNGPDSISPFAGYSEDAWLLVQNALPAALKSAAPGTEAFRVALRGALEKTHDMVGVHGVYSMTPTNHNGMDSRARVLVEAVDGQWKLLQ